MLIIDPQTFDMTMDAGDQEKVQFNIFKADGTPFDGSGSVFSFIAKRDLDDLIGAAAINLVSNVQPGQWDLTNVATGIVILEFLPANSSALGGLRLVYGLKILDTLSKPHTPTAALFTIRKNPVI